MTVLPTNMGQRVTGFRPALFLLYVQSLLALSALSIALLIALSELSGHVPAIFLSKGNGPHPLSVLSVCLFSIAILRRSPFKVQTWWRRVLFMVVLTICLMRLAEIFLLNTAPLSHVTMSLYRDAAPVPLSMGANTALALGLFTLGALIRPRNSTAAFVVTVLGLVPVSHAMFSYFFGMPGGYGEMSPPTLVLLCLVGLSQLFVFFRTPLLRPFLSETPWGRMARRQAAAATVGVFFLGTVFHRSDDTGMSGALLAAVFWLSLVILLAAGPIFERIERERRSLSREMRRQARQDPLTGLLNRRAVRAYIDNHTVAGGNMETVGVLLADIDHFKRVNDTVGHIVGDSVLSELGKKLQSKLRPSDLVARWGGEEFLILLPGANLEQTMTMAQVLRAAVASHVYWEKDGQKEPVTLSIGAAIYAADGSESLEQAIQKADTALYAAKSQGRNRVLCHNAPGGGAQSKTITDYRPKASALH
ncbi:GGDEF domain-containing protein [Celeribacter sp.]|uniref:GGDEF domain-containing protein n=1 Tax=Celeribacter sp. TaxID=1890673 RepID=UPI003A8DB816